MRGAMVKAPEVAVPQWYERFADDFNRADGALGGNYADVVNPGAIQVVSNEMKNAGAATASVRVLTALGNDQYIEVESKATPGVSQPSELYLRWDYVAGTGYILRWSASWTRIYRADPALTLLQSFGAGPAANTVLRFRAYGTTIEALANGAPFGTPLIQTDATYNSGVVGVGFVGNSASHRVDNLSAGEYE